MTLWLTRYKLHRYAAVMHENGITFKLLALLTFTELKDELGISKFADRKRLLKAIKSKREELYTDFLDILAELNLNVLLLDNDSGTERGTKENGRHGQEGGHTAHDDGGDSTAECPFETDEDFEAYFQADEHVIAFKRAFCIGCTAEEFEAYDDDVFSDPCKDAKRAHSRITANFHPDIVGRRFPACKAGKSESETLKNWASVAFTNLGSVYNEMRKECRSRNFRSEL